MRSELTRVTHTQRERGTWCSAACNVSPLFFSLHSRCSLQCTEYTRPYACTVSDSQLFLIEKKKRGRASASLPSPSPFAGSLEEDNKTVSSLWIVIGRLKHVCFLCSSLCFAWSMCLQPLPGSRHSLASETHEVMRCAKDLRL